MKWAGALILVSMVTGILSHSSFHEEQAIAGFNNFTFGIYRQVSAKNQNIILSGLSVALAMGMLQAGAQDQTLQQINTALGLQHLTESQVLKVYRSIMYHAKLQDGNTTLSLANGAFVQKNFSVSHLYQHRLNQDFSAQVRMENFATDGNRAFKDINAWVSNETDHLIPSLFSSPLSTNTIMLLVNTVYFLAKWQSPFNKSETAPATFYGAKGQATVQMMHKSGQLQAGEDAKLNLSIVVLYYSDNHTCMVLLVPNDRNANLASIEKQLNPSELNRLLMETSVRRVNLSMPKFNLTWSSSLKSALQALGIRRAFADNAQLGGISSRAQLKVSEVQQKAVVEVDEEGTKAAAVTTVGVIPTLVRLPLVVNADRPFLFLIQNVTSRLILFIGRASNPSKFTKSGI